MQTRVQEIQKRLLVRQSVKSLKTPLNDDRRYSSSQSVMRMGEGKIEVT